MKAIALGKQVEDCKRIICVCLPGSLNTSENEIENETEKLPADLLQIDIICLGNYSYPISAFTNFNCYSYDKSLDINFASILKRNLRLIRVHSKNIICHATEVKREQDCYICLVDGMLIIEGDFSGIQIVDEGNIIEFSGVECEVRTSLVTSQRRKPGNYR